MKKNLIGAIVLFAALVLTGCGNNSETADKKQKKEQENTEQADAKVKKPQLPNRLLIIVDPQVDFTTGSLATANGPAAMDYLANALKEGAWKNYGWIVVTQDEHPANHCSFVEQGGDFPPHCVQGTEGQKVYPALQQVLMDILSDIPNIHFMQKGTLPEKEEFSVFQNEQCGEKLRRTIEEFEHFEGIDICGIATDYCVYETTKDLIAFYPAKQVRIVTNCLAAVDESDTKLADLMKENGIQGIAF
ncbi:MAG: isochorismatase family protein [Bacteroidales bacterium]|nr:isochorismatase family protein [Bacteroidales bacterium]